MANLTDKARGKFWAKVSIGEPNACWLWLGPINWSKCKKGMNGGYGHTTIDGEGMPPCRASWLLTNGSIPDDLEVCHTCDVRHCVNPKHLYLGTHSQNIIDARKRGRLRMPHGIKLDEGKVREIVRLSREGWPGTELSRLYGVTPPTIYGVLIGRIWKDVTVGMEIERPTREAWLAGVHSARQREGTARAQSIMHTCEFCGRVVKGNAIGYHRKACARTTAEAANQ